MAAGGEEFMSDEIVNNKCCVCAKKDKRQEADKYCMECKGYFCVSCVDIHAMIPSTAGHKLLNKADFKSFKHSGSLPSYSTLRCPVHPSKVVDMFCEDHDEVACTSCIALNHRSCKHVYSVPDKTDYLLNILELRNVKLRSEETKSKLEESKKSHEAHLKELKKSLNTAMDSVKSFKQQLQDLLDKLEQETIAELQKEYHKIESSLLEDIREHENLIAALNDMLSKLKKAEGNASQEFVCAKFSEQLAVKGKEMTHLQGQKYETVSFSTDKSIDSYLKQIHTLGNVATTEIVVTKTPSTAQPVSLTAPIMSKTGLYKISKQRNVEIKLPDDKVDCNITCALATENGYILLADTDNQKVKRFDPSTETVTDYVSLTSAPIAVCQVRKTEAAVSLGKHTVQFVTLGDKLTATRTLKFKHVCSGLAYNNGKLFITDQGKSVYLYDMDGNELRRITTDLSANDIFNTTKHIAVSDDGDRVFVTDFDRGLITLDIQGKYISALSESDIGARGCTGVCTDGSNVIVCGYSSRNIVQIGHDNKLLGEIGKVSFPKSVCFYKNNSLIITREFENTLTVMELI